MKILAIETSCDETALAVLDCNGGYKRPICKIISHVLYSQITEHRKYGGVYPNLAKRLHSQNLVPILKETLRNAGLLNTLEKSENYSNILKNIGIVLEREPDLLDQFTAFIPTIKKPPIDAIAVTQGPGLEPALWVGLNFAKALSLVWNIPIIPVNHMEGHIASVLYKNDQPLLFPLIALLISGGHTQLVRAKEWGKYKVLGETRDDAVGEAFDKVARILGLPYPGGPEISNLAKRARTKKDSHHSTVLQNNRTTETGKMVKKVTQNKVLKVTTEIELPRPMINSDNYDFSFSGLKTAVLYKVKKIEKLDQKTKQEIAREFEDAIADVLISKTQGVLKAYKPKTLIVAGGVIANKKLREDFETMTEQFPNIKLRIPHTDVAGDNAIMIGITGYIRSHIQKKEAEVQTSNLRAQGNLRLGG